MTSDAKTPSPENKQIAQHVLAAFGGTPTVHAYHHDFEPLSIDIVSCKDQPCDGVTAYSTIGVSDYPVLRNNGSVFPGRLEISGACATVDEEFPNVIASAAFNIIRSKRLFSPGTAMKDYVKEYFASTSVPHLYFTAPFLWEDKLTTLTCESKTVSWLLAIPISEGELEFLLSNGDDALETRFEEEQIDVFDLTRDSVV